MQDDLKVTVVKGISSPHHELNMFKVLLVLTHAFVCGKPLTAEEILAELPEKYTTNNKDDMRECIRVLEERRILSATENRQTEARSYILKDSLAIEIYLNHLRV